MKVKAIERFISIFLLLIIVFIFFLNVFWDQQQQSTDAPATQPDETTSSSDSLPLPVLTTEELKLGVGRSHSLVSTEELSDLVPLNEITFSSDDESIASVSHTGTVTAHREGTATISAVTRDGGTASCQVTVVPLTRLECTLTVNLFSPTILSQTLSLPEGTQWTSLVWISSDPDVATAEGDEVRGQGFGSTVLAGSWDTGELYCTVQTSYGGQLIAHRGFSGQAPENTIPAFTLAGEAGVWGIETDVHCTADGVFVCIHDEDIKKMTNGSGSISAYTYEQLMQYEIDTGNGIQNYEHLTIPTLEEYLAICKAYQVTAVIELKEDFPEEQIPAFYDLLCATEMEKQCVCISFDLGLLRVLRESTAEIPVQYVVKEATELDVDNAAALGNSGIDFKTADTDLISYAIAQGCTTNVWTVDDPAEQETWRKAGIDFITTNQPISSNTD